MEGIEILFKQNLLQSVLWDQHLAGSMDNGGNMETVLFAQKFDFGRIQFLKEKFPLTCDQLTKLHQLQSATRSVQEAVGNGAGAHPVHQQQQQPPVALPIEAAPMPPAAADAMAQRGYDDQEMTSKVEIIMREWIGLCYSPTGQRSPQESLAQMFPLMHKQGILATDDKITQFFRQCVENCVDISVRVMKSEQMDNGLPTTLVRHRCYYTLDAFVKLMALMIRHSDNGQSQNKINLLKKTNCSTRTPTPTTSAASSSSSKAPLADHTNPVRTTRRLPSACVGLVFMFIEGVKNATYNSWKYEFTSCALEIQEPEHHRRRPAHGPRNPQARLQRDALQPHPDQPLRVHPRQQD